MSESTQSSNPEPPAGSPCWIEIPATDVAASKEFYASIFPEWTFKPLPPHYSPDKLAMFSLPWPKGLTGGICLVDKIEPAVAAVTVYHFVPSIDEIAKKILELGGTKVTEKEKEGEHGMYQRFRDPWGVGVAVYEVLPGVKCGPPE